MKKNKNLEDFLRFIERKELSEEQQTLLTFGGNGPEITVNNHYCPVKNGNWSLK